MDITIQMIVNWMKNPDTFLAQLGKKISARRKELNLTQSDLAARLNVSQQQVAFYENGRREIPLTRLLNLADSLAVSVDELVDLGHSRKRKPGPAPKLQKQLEEISLLPRKKQQFVSQVIDQLLAAERS